MSKHAEHSECYCNTEVLSLEQDVVKWRRKNGTYLIQIKSFKIDEAPCRFSIGAPQGSVLGPILLAVRYIGVVLSLHIFCSLLF